MSTQPVLRSTRAAIFAAVCASLAAAAHTLAAHTAVAPWSVAVGFAAVYAVAWTLGGAERSLITIMGGLLGGQFALHSLFTSAMPGMSAMSGTSAPGMGHVSEHLATATPGHPGGWSAMTLAHVAAAVLSAWWLRRGERAAWRLARWAATLASRPVRMLLALLDAPPRAVVAAPISSRTTAPSRASRARLLRHAVVRRGPPFTSTVFIHG